MYLTNAEPASTRHAVDCVWRHLKDPDGATANLVLQLQ
jgi:hypothetical protein